ncbi:MAG: hypothetical protein M0016_07035 [Deltaproteobacteria bacterium]|nr:hypothetical protein [Deltaproteobacteria bacterium]MCL5880589.1 hypothetical protein [Deltaproteobacteria bacterium]MDA8304900.1 hypothetical protein [Deltaproteobacteria bacterium]
MGKNTKKYKKFTFHFNVLASFTAAVTIIIAAYLGAAYSMGIPLPDIGAISTQIQSVETAAGGAFSALQGLAGTLGYAPGASGGPLFNPGPGMSEAMATADKLTADVSKMQEQYQNIIINYDKLGHLVNSVENAVNNVNNLNNRINNAFSQIPQELTQSDVYVSSPQNLISGINIEESEFQNLNNKGNSYNPQDFISGISTPGTEILNRSGLESESKQFTGGAVYNADGNSGKISPAINCASYDNGYYLDGKGNYTAGCTDLVNGFVIDAASSNLYNAGVSAARAHKAELEGDGFMNEITSGALNNSTNYYSYQSSVLTLIAEEDAANLKNLGYIESQLKQMELSRSASEIKKEHVGAIILPQSNNIPGMNFYNKTTL